LAAIEHSAAEAATKSSSSSQSKIGKFEDEDEDEKISASGEQLDGLWYKEHKARRADSEGQNEAGNYPLKYSFRPFLCVLCTTIQQSLCSLRKFFLLILILILILALLFWMRHQPRCVLLW